MVGPQPEVFLLSSDLLLCQPMFSVFFKMLRHLMSVVLLLYLSVKTGSSTSLRFPALQQSQIKPGALVMYGFTRNQRDVDLHKRACGLHMQLSEILDPPFDAAQKRVNIRSLLNASMYAGVKPKHLILAKSMFDGDDQLSPSSNQKIKIKLYKIRPDLRGDQFVQQQKALARDQSDPITAVFLLSYPRVREEMMAYSSSFEGGQKSKIQ